MLVRASNGREWSDWDRLNIYTETNWFDSLDYGRYWNTRMGQGRELTYTFLHTLPGYYDPDADPEADDFTTYNSVQREMARRALQQFANISGLSFRETTQEDELGHVTFAGHSGGDEAAHAFFPASVVPSKPGDVWINLDSDNTDWNATEDGGAAYFIHLHELGHAMGLTHTFPGGGGSVFLPAATENAKFTVMTYSNIDGDPPTGSDLWIDTLGLYDVAAIQRMYGANMNYNSGKTVYRWANNASFVETIWDGGGIDVISAANQSRSAVIDLREGMFSSIGAVANNVSIAFNAVIENANGGRNDDVLRGNEIKNFLRGNEGNDTLRGLGGNDTMSGGTGDDRYIYTVGDGKDRILESGGTDVLVIRVQDNLYNDFPNNPLENSLKFRRQGKALDISLTMGGERGRGTITIANQRRASSRVETLRLRYGDQRAEFDIDLSSIYTGATSAFSHFQRTEFETDFGFVATRV